MTVKLRFVVPSRTHVPTAIPRLQFLDEQSNSWKYVQVVELLDEKQVMEQRVGKPDCRLCAHVQHQVHSCGYPKNFCVDGRLFWPNEKLRLYLETRETNADYG